jgi:serpin B
MLAEAMAALDKGVAEWFVQEGIEHPDNPSRNHTEEISMNTTSVPSDFATRLYAKLAGTEASNLFFSPFSIQVALAMCSVGAKGETRHELTDLIGAPESVDEQNRKYAALLQSVQGEGKCPIQLVTANALWGQQGFHFNTDFQEAIADFYDAALHVVNFKTQPDEAVKAINSWVSNKTRARIKELIGRDLINEDTRLILTNAIYFKGQWESVFEKSATKDEDWHGSKTSKVPMMRQKGGFLYYEGDDFQAVNLPYKGRQLSMLIVLPRKKDGLPALESRWATQQMFRQVTGGFDSESVIISLPRFKIESEFKLRPTLCALHADLAFSDAADFGGIADESLKISEVIHKAFVEVNEEGTEAAAATAVLMMRSMGVASRSPEPKVFKADHPFLFFIWDRKTNSVFFSGRVIDPK